MGNARAKNVNVMLLQVQSTELGRVREESKIALIGKQGMGARVRSDDDCAFYICSPQSIVTWLLQGEVHQTIVNKVDRLTAAIEAIVLKGELFRIGDEKVS